MKNLIQLINEELKLTEGFNHSIIDDGYWSELIEKAKKLYGIDDIKIRGYNTNKPEIFMYKSGFNPVLLWSVKPEHIYLIKTPKHYEYITNWILEEVIPKNIQYFTAKDKQLRVSKNLSASEKVELIIKILEKANHDFYDEYHKIDVSSKSDSKRVSLREKFRNKYEDKIYKLYLEVYNTPEWKNSIYGNSPHFSEPNDRGIADINFGELVFAI